MTRINNKTPWDTETLADIVARCNVEIRKTESKVIKRVNVETHRLKARWHGGVHAWVGGYAYYHSDWLTLKLPLPKYGALMAWKVADTYIHEVGHCMGIRHRRIKGEKALATFEHLFKDFLTTFGNEQVPVGKPEPKKKVDHQAIRFSRAQANLIKAATRLKRAQTIHRKWKKKVSYYQTTAAARINETS